MADYEFLDQNGQPRYITKRVRFYDNQVLIDQDFIDEQKYQISGQWRQRRLLNVSGITEGLTVQTTGGLKVSIAAGSALDSMGRHILLEAAVEFTVTRLGTQRLYIRFREEESDEAARGKGAAGKTRFWQRPEIGSAEPGALPTYAVVLATLDASSTTVTVKSEGREYSGIRLPGPVAGSAPTLRSGGDSSYSTAVLTGSLSITGNLTAAAVKVTASTGANVFEVKTDGGVTAGTGTTPPFQLSSAGVITAASGITSSGTIKLSSLPGDGATGPRFVKVGTDGVLSSTPMVDLSSSEVANTLPFARGGTGQSSWTQNALVFVSGSTSLGSILPATNSILATGNTTSPALTQTLPTAVQGNITKVGTLGSLSVGTSTNKFAVSEGGAVTSASGLTIGTSTTKFNVDASGILTDAAGLTSSGTIKLSSLPGSGATAPKFVKVGVDGTLASVSSVDLSTAEVAATLPTVRGGTGQTAWTPNALVFASDSSRLGGLPPVANSVLVTNSSAAPGLATTLPIPVQDTISRLGTVVSGSIGSGFGDITTPNLNATTSIKTGGTTRIDATGNLSDINTLTATGTLSTKNSASGDGVGGVLIDRADAFKEANLRFATAGQNRWSLQLDNDNTDHLRLVSAGGPGFVAAWDYALGNSMLRGDLALNNVFLGPGTVSLKNGTTDTLQGESTSFSAIQAGDSIRVNGTTYTVASLVSSTELKVSGVITGLLSGSSYAYTWRSANPFLSCSGKVSLRSGTKDTLLGSNTTFLSIFQPGDQIRITVSSAAFVTARVKSISNDGELKVTDALSLTEGTQYSFSVQKLTRKLSFGASRLSLIEFNSSSAEYGDKGFILFQEHSTQFGGSSTGIENARLSIGIGTDVGSTTTTDTVDIQGSHLLTLNAGSWDEDLNTVVGSIASTVTPSGISFRINNSEKVKLDSTGKFLIGEGYSGTSVATLLSVGTSNAPFQVDSAGAITSATSASVGTGTNKFTVDSTGAITASTTLSVGTSTKFTVSNTGAITAATSISAGTATNKFVVDSTGAVTAPTTLSAGGGKFTVDSSGALTAAASLAAGGGKFTVDSTGAVTGATSLSIAGAKFVVDSTGALTVATSITTAGALTLSALGAGATGTRFVRQDSATGKLSYTSSVDITSSDITGVLPFAKGGTGASTFTTNGILFGNSSTALGSTAAAANSVLVTSSSNVPSLATSLPTAVQDNITRLGAVASGSIASGFGSITTTTLNATTAVQTNGTTRIDASGNLTSINDLTLSGKLYNSSSSALFKFESYSSVKGGTGYSTGYSTNSWHACIVGFDAGTGDLYEDKSGSNLLKVYCYEDSSTWYIKADIRTHDSTTWTVKVLFISKNVCY